MSYYMVHAGMARKNYVDRYLIPSMVEQGIPKNHIIRILDINKEGCLTMYKKAYRDLPRYIPKGTEGVWHIQDDVVISRKFKELTEKYDEGVVCGFCSGWHYDIGPMGNVPSQDMWFSSPCIRIPIKYSTEFLDWLEASEEPEVILHVEMNKGEDFLFKRFLSQVYPDLKVLNLSPNPVDHIDYLIGGSTVNQQRGPTIVKSTFWVDECVTEGLKMRLGILN